LYQNSFAVYTSKIFVILSLKQGKILNDPVHGFIKIPQGLIFELIEHPYFQRLRRIRQLGLTDFVYPGALHTRFHHALGVMHLMGVALDTLQTKGHEISEQEREAAQIAALLHDIGHSPLSHALEATILQGVHHERLSLLIMEKLNQKFHGALSLAIQIFTNQYERKFFHQLVSSQLDVDRLDYLQRDCFFTGVSEGAIGGDRILKMLDVYENNLVIEEKGIYSVENFLTARRLMYWQVYLHKTTISTEQMIVQAILRAKYLAKNEKTIFASPSLSLFMNQEVNVDDFKKDEKYLEAFAQLDDYDIWGAIKIWQHHHDTILSNICKMILGRKLFKIILRPEKIDSQLIQEKQSKVLAKYAIAKKDVGYLVVSGTTKNMAYQENTNPILILTKKKGILDISEASDLPNIKALTKIVKKYYLCFAQC
jgi:HD superfamily phosphohydrolase